MKPHLLFNGIVFFLQFSCLLCEFSISHHDQFAVLDFSDVLGLLPVPLLDVNQLVSVQSHSGLKRHKQKNLQGKKILVVFHF